MKLKLHVCRAYCMASAKPSVRCGTTNVGVLGTILSSSSKKCCCIKQQKKKQNKASVMISNSKPEISFYLYSIHAYRTVAVLILTFKLTRVTVFESRLCTCVQLCKFASKLKIMWQILSFTF